MYARQGHPTVLQGPCSDPSLPSLFILGFGGGLWGLSVGSRHGDVLVSVAMPVGGARLTRPSLLEG